MKWITATDIANWANTQQKHCQGTLPELVGRLILAHTANDVEEFEFPNGDSVATGGWDGRLKTPVTFLYFPTGVSGWEIGTEKSAEKKVEADYVKRVTDPRGTVPSDTTFVFVTPRSFTKRDKWVATKKALGDWKDVRVIAADSLTNLNFITRVSLIVNIARRKQSFLVEMEELIFWITKVSILIRIVSTYQNNLKQKHEPSKKAHVVGALG